MDAHEKTNPWVVIATWPFSLDGAAAAAQGLAEGASAADMAERLACMTEQDESIDSIGLGGCPNANGEMELDAAFMDGDTMAVGAVAALQGFAHPVSVARCVMEKSVHNFFVGAGAADFATEQGFEREIMLTVDSIARWHRLKTEQEQQTEAKVNPCDSHDTIGVVVLDQSAHMVSATSSSGLAMKHRGRVGDSPLIGSGFYVDSQIGGAAATGVGEDIMKGCTCFAAVSLMQQGMHPQQAAEEALRRTHLRIRSHANYPSETTGDGVGMMAIVCADRFGRYGGAANHDEFSYAVATADEDAHLVKVSAIRLD